MRLISLWNTQAMLPTCTSPIRHKVFFFFVSHDQSTCFRQISILKFVDVIKALVISHVTLTFTGTFDLIWSQKLTFL